MEAAITEVVGALAAVLGSVLMLPQVIKTWRSRSAAEISFWMLVVYLTQCVLWIYYGWQKQAHSLVACNVLAFCIVALQLYLKQRFAAAGARVEARRG